MLEVAAKALESGIAKEAIEKKSGEINPLKISGEIFEKPGTDIKPQWKPKTEVSALFKAPNSDFTPQWKESPELVVSKCLNTRNGGLEGTNHPETGVPFEKKPIVNDKGESDEGVFPQFESTFNAKLPPELYKESDAKQFSECNEQLKEGVERNPELAKKFTPEQLEQIRNGDTPDGYTWHHNKEAGKMQLVDSETHSKTGHTGGRLIWGGGQENR